MPHTLRLIPANTRAGRGGAGSRLVAFDPEQFVSSTEVPPPTGLPNAISRLQGIPHSRRGRVEPRGSPRNVRVVDGVFQQISQGSPGFRAGVGPSLQPAGFNLALAEFLSPPHQEPEPKKPGGRVGGGGASMRNALLQEEARRSRLLQGAVRRSTLSAGGTILG